MARRRKGLRRPVTTTPAARLRAAHQHSPLYSRTFCNLIQPALDVDELVQLQQLTGVIELVKAHDKRKYCDVRNCVLVPRHPILPLQLLIKHPKDAPCLSSISVDTVLNLFWRILEKMAELTEHRANASHLPKQPLNDLIFLVNVLGEKLSSLLRQIKQNGAGFEDSQRLAVWTIGIDNCWNFGIRIDAFKRICELLAFHDVYSVGLVRNSELLKGNADFLPVGRGKGVKLNFAHINVIVKDKKKPKKIRSAWRS
mmetsp:Transcript_8269/g.14179  ORF Transcript_8269/g.14179 Transcript_8269/m.14179 type:complete len:255 (-) Transcript_8269:171-935(-)